MDDKKIKPFTVGINEGGYVQNGPPYPQSTTDDTTATYGQPQYNPLVYGQYTQQQYMTPIDPQHLYDEHTLKIQEDMFIASERAKIQAAKEIAVSKEKAHIRAAERQLKKAEYDVPFIHPDDGSVCIETKNCIVQSPPIRIANFCSPKLIVIHHLGEIDEKIYQFTCRIGQQKKCSFLSEKKCKSPSYILNKLMDIGGHINADPGAKQRGYIQKLWAMLINEHQDDIFVPDKNGWYKDNNGQIRFWEEAYTWEILVKLTK